MSNQVRCPNGHFYDTNIYTSCPYCDNLSGYRKDRDQENGGTRALETIGIPTERVRENPTVPTPGGHGGGTVSPEDPVTINVHSNTSVVVGWLAGIEGPYLGKSFELHCGYNRVGRKEGDIKLEKDSSISRANHFRIVYDEEDNHFLFFAGDSDNYPRLNGEKKYDGERTELKPYSVIEAGKSKFMFVPLCSEYFRWPEEIMTREMESKRATGEA